MMKESKHLNLYFVLRPDFGIYFKSPQNFMSFSFMIAIFSDKLEMPWQKDEVIWVQDKVKISNISKI